MRILFHRTAILMSASLALLGGCASYQVVHQTSDYRGITLGLPDGDAEYVLVRIENNEDGFLFIDWGGTRLRGPDRFEIPASVQPTSRLTYLHPGSRAEYHLHPDHQYRAPDQAMHRRSSLSHSIVDEALYAKNQPYEVAAFVKICSSPRLDGCKPASPQCCGETSPAVCSGDAQESGVWRSVKVSGKIVKVR